MVLIYHFAHKSGEDGLSRIQPKHAIFEKAVAIKRRRLARAQIYVSAVIALGWSTQHFYQFYYLWSINHLITTQVRILLWVTKRM